MDAPRNVWEAACLSLDDEWGPGVRGARMLERPRDARLTAATWELDPGERRLAPGELVHFPVGASGAHQVVNDSSAVVRYLMIAARQQGTPSSTSTSAASSSSATCRPRSSRTAQR